MEWYVALGLEREKLRAPAPTSCRTLVGQSESIPLPIAGRAQGIAPRDFDLNSRRALGAEARYVDTATATASGPTYRARGVVGRTVRALRATPL